jgi:hypothetical protein
MSTNLKWRQIYACCHTFEFSFTIECDVYGIYSLLKSFFEMLTLYLVDVLPFWQRNVINGENLINHLFPHSLYLLPSATDMHIFSEIRNVELWFKVFSWMIWLLPEVNVLISISPSRLKSELLYKQVCTHEPLNFIKKKRWLTCGVEHFKANINMTLCAFEADWIFSKLQLQMHGCTI